MNRLARTARHAGMTLIEIMIVIAILGLLAGIIGVAVINQLEEARRGAALTQIKAFESALQLYNRDCGKYPNTAVGLNALVQNPGNCPRWKPGYLAGSSIPADPWGNAYEYFHPGTHGHEIEIISKGKDAELNTADDVVSWQEGTGGNVAGGGGN